MRRYLLGAFVAVVGMAIVAGIFLRGRWRHLDLDSIDRMNYCRDVNECIDSGIADNMCETLCGGRGLLINVKERENLSQYRAKHMPDTIACLRLSCEPKNPKCNIQCVQFRCREVCR